MVDVVNYWTFVVDENIRVVYYWITVVDFLDFYYVVDVSLDYSNHSVDLIRIRQNSCIHSVNQKSKTTTVWDNCGTETFNLSRLRKVLYYTSFIILDLFRRSDQ